MGRLLSISAACCRNINPPDGWDLHQWNYYKKREIGLKGYSMFVSSNPIQPFFLMPPPPPYLLAHSMHVLNLVSENVISNVIYLKLNNVQPNTFLRIYDISYMPKTSWRICSFHVNILDIQHFVQITLQCHINHVIKSNSLYSI
jgi:hypothetical protein